MRVLKQAREVEQNCSRNIYQSVWQVILSDIMKRGMREDEFKNAWLELFDGVLFDQASNPSSNATGLSLIITTIASAPVGKLSAVLSPNMIQTLMKRGSRSTSSGDQMLRRKERDVLEAMVARVKKEPDTATIFIDRIVAADGLPDFDRLTQTKTVEEILANANPTSMDKIIEALTNTMHTAHQSGGDGAIPRLRRLCDLGLTAIRNRSDLTPHICWIQKLVRYFVQSAFFVDVGITAKAAHPRIEGSKVNLRFFQGQLSHLVTTLSSKIADGASWTHFAATSVKQIQGSPSAPRLASDINREMQKVIDVAFTELEAFTKKTRAKAGSVYEALRLLFSLVILQMYDGESEAYGIVDELVECAKQVTSASSSEQTSVDTVIDFILSFLPKDNALPRDLAQEAFILIAPVVSKDSLVPLYDILLKKESLSGQKELFEHEDEIEEDVDSASDVEEELASDVELAGASNANESESTGDDTSDGDDDPREIGNDSTEEEDEELTRFNSLLAQTLGTGSSRQAEEGIDGSTDHESDMDSDQMMEIDEQLSAAFQMRQVEMGVGKKKDQKSATKNVRDFKGRVLSLLETYLKQEYTQVASVSAVLPLLKLQRSTKAQHLAQRAHKILAAYSETCGKKKTYPALDNETAASMLQEIHGEAAMDGSNMHAAACSRASLFVAKCLLVASPTAMDLIVEVYSDTMRRWVTEGVKSRIRPAFFTNWVGWSDEMRKARGGGRSSSAVVAVSSDAK